MPPLTTIVHRRWFGILSPLLIKTQLYLKSSQLYNINNIYISYFALRDKATKTTTTIITKKKKRWFILFLFFSLSCSLVLFIYFKDSVCFLFPVVTFDCVVGWLRCFQISTHLRKKSKTMLEFANAHTCKHARANTRKQQQMKRYACVLFVFLDRILF